MSEQLSLLPERPRIGAPFQPSSETSRDAARRIAPKVANIRELIYQAVVAAGKRGITAKELEITSISRLTIGARLNELEHEQPARIGKRYELEAGKVKIVRRDGCGVYVATRNQRAFLGVELNPEYAQMARKQIADDAPLFAEVPA